MIMLSKNIDEKYVTPVDNNPSTIDHARLLSNDIGDEEVDFESEDILNLTLAKIKKNRKSRKIIRSKPIVVRWSLRLKKVNFESIHDNYVLEQ
jgi:hypothetical protein